jgi:hypothetical protein
LRPKDTDYDLNDIKFKPSELWTLRGDSCYGEIKGPLSALHRNPTVAIGGERNHKAAKRVHSRSRARLRQAKIETGTAILFNSKQLDRRIAAIRDTIFCKWLQQLGADCGDDAEEELLDEEEDAAGGSIEELDRLESCLAASTALLTRISSTRRWWTRVAPSIEVGLMFVLYNLVLYGIVR